MSKVAIVTPNERNMLEGAGDRRPLGAMYVATAAKKAGHDARIYDLNHTEKKHFLEDMKWNKPDVVGFSVVSSPSYNQMKDLIDETIRVTPASTLVVGGYHAMARPQDFPNADYVIKGDGEQAIVDILEGRKPSKEMQRVNFNNVPFPDTSLVNTNNYQMDQKGKRTATMITSRGCPFSCIFCGNYDKKVRFRSPESIRGELEQLADAGFESLYLLDDAFTVNKQHAKDVSDIIKDYGMTFRATTRADLLDNKLIEYLAYNGLQIASIGVESGNNEILKRANKNTTTDEIERAVGELYANGVDSKGFFIFGLPGETPKEAQETIDFSMKLKYKGLTSADFYAMTPFPGTPIYKDPQKFGGRIIHHDWDKYLEIGKQDVSPAWETDTMSAKQIKHFMKEAKEAWNS